MVTWANSADPYKKVKFTEGRINTKFKVVPALGIQSAFQFGLGKRVRSTPCQKKNSTSIVRVTAHLPRARLTASEILWTILLDIALNGAFLSTHVTTHHHRGLTFLLLVPTPSSISMLAHIMSELHHLGTLQFLCCTSSLATLARSFMATRQCDHNLLVTVWMVPFPVAWLMACVPTIQACVANMMALLPHFQIHFRMAWANQWKLGTQTVLLLQGGQHLNVASDRISSKNQERQ